MRGRQYSDSEKCFKYGTTIRWHNSALENDLKRQQNKKQTNNKKSYIPLLTIILKIGPLI